MNTEIKKILIVRTDRIGDVVLTIPMASVIKKQIPGVIVDFLVQGYTAPLLYKHPDIDNVIAVESIETTGFGDLVKIFKANNYDSVITAFPKFKLAYAMFISGIKTRIGTGYRWYSFLFNKKIYDHRKNAAFHELEYGIRMLSEIGVEYFPEPGDINFNIQINEQSEQKTIQLLKEAGYNKNLKTIIIHPGSGGSAEDWPVTHFKKITEMMAHNLEINILLTGSLKEFEMCEQLSVKGKTINLAGKLNLSEFIALINKTDILVANSTGPIHIAAALNKEVIGFYPKIIQCSEKRWGPYTKKKTVFTPSIECKNCNKEQCRKLNCMSTIEPDKVFETICRKIEELK